MQYKRHRAVCDYLKREIEINIITTLSKHKPQNPDYEENFFCSEMDRCQCPDCELKIKKHGEAYWNLID